MIGAIYLAKVMAGQCLLLLFYHLLFSRFPARNFVRIFLVLCPLLAFVAPLLPVYPPVAPTSQTPPLHLSETEAVITAAAPPLPIGDVVEGGMPWLTILLITVYLIGVAYGLIRMGAFLLSVHRRLRSATLIKGPDYTDAVLPDRTVPHAFLRWVFYGSGASPDPLILAHERAHARQWHSVDRLFIASLRIVWWWNPALYGYESAIRANHEFLADRAVLQQGVPLGNYQTALLAALRTATHRSRSYASYAGTSLTKKRFQLMETQLPGNAGRLLRYALAIVLAVSVTAVFASRSPSPNALAGGAAVPSEFPATGQAPSTSGVAADSLLPPPPVPDSLRFGERAGNLTPPTENDLRNWRNPREYGVWLDGKRISNARLEDYGADAFDHYYRSRILRNAVNYGQHDYQIDLFTKEYFRKWYEIRPDGTFVPRPKVGDAVPSPRSGTLLWDIDDRLQLITGRGSANPNDGGEGC